MTASVSECMEEKRPKTIRLPSEIELTAQEHGLGR